jgi:3-phenylpropionate/trans-cinnamate dioxygenase ferredoxin reductase subunit
MNVNVWDVVDDLKAIVTARQPVEVARLVDPDVPLGALVATGRR